MDPFADVGAVILAAGKGTRMESDLPKVLHEVHGKSMVCHVIDAVKPFAAGRIYLVIGHRADLVKAVVSKVADVRFAFQEQLTGTAEAVRAAVPVLPEMIKTVLVLCGDVPLIRTGSLRAMIRQHVENGNDMTVMTVDTDTPYGYGRIVTDSKGEIIRIVEESDATAPERKITRINTGIYLFNRQMMVSSLSKITIDNQQKEYYLTDMAEIVHDAGGRVGSWPMTDPREVMGVNTLEELQAVNRYMERTRHELP